MGLPISLDERTGLIIQEPTRSQPNRNIETNKKINENKHRHNLNKQSKTSETEIRDDTYCQLEFETSS